jgi:hypothetical protein
VAISTKSLTATRPPAHPASSQSPLTCRPAARASGRRARSGWRTGSRGPCHRSRPGSSCPAEFNDRLVCRTRKEPEQRVPGTRTGSPERHNRRSGAARTALPAGRNWRAYQADRTLADGSQSIWPPRSCSLSVTRCAGSGRGADLSLQAGRIRAARSYLRPRRLTFYLAAGDMFGRTEPSARGGTGGQSESGRRCRS